MDQKRTRNLSTIVHIDHGEPTLADHILEITDIVEQREMKERLLDTMDLERERGITIRLNAIQLKYKVEDGQDYIFHLIDTPGYVDSTYEISCSLTACEGAVLVMSTVQGVEAQTLANVYLALDNDLETIPMTNKVDLPSAQPDIVRKEIEDVTGLDVDDISLISAESGLNTKDMPEAAAHNVPASSGGPHASLQTPVFDPLCDAYRGVIAYARVKEGTLRVGDHTRFMTSGTEYGVLEVGIRNPRGVKKDVLECGEVGWVRGSIKSIKDVCIGDTITHVDHPAEEASYGYQEMNSMVYCGLYPIDSSKYSDLQDTLGKLQLDDASLQFEVETSQAPGLGSRCGFLGLLYMNVIQECIEREYHIDPIATIPSAVYHAYLMDGSIPSIDNPSLLPDMQKIDHTEEPFVCASIMTPNDYVGPIMESRQHKYGSCKDMAYIDEGHMNVIYELSLGEVVFDFFDELKSYTKGYVSLDYEPTGCQTDKLAEMDILLNGETADVLSSIVYRELAYLRRHAIREELKKLTPKQQFETPIRAAINGKIIARADIKSLCKNMLAKCYGGDTSRKKKLLEGQKEGKKRMKPAGSVEASQGASMVAFSTDDDDK